MKNYSNRQINEEEKTEDLSAKALLQKLLKRYTQDLENSRKLSASMDDEEGRWRDGKESTLENVIDDLKEELKKLA
jgi:molecular chaperone GrpE (heat shock protein)